MYAESNAQRVEHLVAEHSELVRRIAHHLLARLPASVMVEDLYQAGMIGLLDAIQRFDGSKGASFETYAGIRIRGAMVDEIRKGDWAPRSVHKNARRIQDAIRQVESETGNDASDREVARALGVSLDEYQSMLADTVATRLFSLDEITGRDEEGVPRTALLIPPGDESEPEIQAQAAYFQRHLAAAIERLSEREQLVISLYYEEELNLKEIGEVLGVSESRISQILSSVSQKLRARLHDWV